MTFLACTLLADGTSDRVLKPILDWLLDEHCAKAHEIQVAEALMGNPKGLSARIKAALDQYPCELLFVHRDAETMPYETRLREIEYAWGSGAAGATLVTIIPVRMTEAWLLLDESAIRTASGNPGGRMRLDLPASSKVEALPDPKEVLFEALRKASGLAAGRLRRFSPAERRHRVPELRATFEHLRALPSFCRLEAQIERAFHD